MINKSGRQDAGELLHKLKEIIKFQVIEEGFDSSFDIFKERKKVEKYLILNENNQDFLMFTNKLLEIDYQESENGDETKYIFFAFCYTENGLYQNQKEAFLEKVKDEILEDYKRNPIPWKQQFVEIKVYFITKNIETSMQIEKSFNLNNDNSDFRKCIQKTIKQLKDSNQIVEASKRIFPLKNITVTYEFLGEEFVKKPNEVQVLSRTFATPSNLLENPITRGIVFSAKLFDLVSIYNLKGKSLFSKNIRQGIKEVLGVDDAIYNTLKEKPEEFWFYNNGITILVEKKHLDLKNHKKISLSDSKNGIKLTVLNGAQTLNSAARFFYKEDDEITSVAKNKAYVMLKVIEIESVDGTESEGKNNNGDNRKQIEDRINQTTVSLNRQKPVVQIDIAFTLPVIKYINTLNEYFQSKAHKLEKKEDSKLRELERFSFSIVRRGEASSVQNKRYSLLVLPRVLAAIFMKAPGQARTSSIDTLMKIDQTKNHFSHDELFPILKDAEQKIIDDDDQAFKELFLKQYRPVNFAMSLITKIEELSDLVVNKLSNEAVKSEDSNKTEEVSTSNSEEIKLNENSRKILLYGKYLMLYSIVYALKNESDNTFETWTYGMEDVDSLLNEEKFKEIINVLENAWDDQVKATNKWDSNAFKSNTNKVDAADSCLTEIKAILLKSKV